MLHEIEEKKLGLEVRLADVIATEISKFHKEHGLPVKAVYVSLENVSAIDEPNPVNTFPKKPPVVDPNVVK